MKKYLIAAVFVFSVLSAPFFAFAETETVTVPIALSIKAQNIQSTAEMVSLINLLKQLVASLQDKRVTTPISPDDDPFVPCQGGALFNSVTGARCVGNNTQPNRGVTYIQAGISPSSPSERIVETSSSQATAGVVSGVFKLESQNNNSNLNSVSFNVSTNFSTTLPLSSIVSNVRLTDKSGQVYEAGSISGNTVTFNNLNIRLPLGQSQDITVKFDVAAGVNNVMLTSTLLASSIRGVDDNFFAVSAAPNTSNVSASMVTLRLSSGTAQTTGSLYTRLSPNSPAAQTYTTSASQTTSVTLGAFNIQSQNFSSRLNKISFDISNNFSTTLPLTSILSNVRLVDQNFNSYEGSISGNTVSFSNLSIPLPSTDQWQSVTLLANVAAGIDNVILTPTLLRSSLVAVDNNFNFASTIHAINVSASPITFEL